MSTSPDFSATGGARILQAALPGGVSLHYVTRGDAGETVILLHGGMGDCLSWDFQLAALAPRFRVVSYSRRYHFPNRNPPAGGSHSSNEEAKDLDAFIRVLDCGPVHLIGTSYGALTALTFAIDQPDQVLSLVLAEPPVLCWLASEGSESDIVETFLQDVWIKSRQQFDQGRAESAMQILCDGMRGPSVFESLDPPQRSAIMRNAQAMEMLVRSTNPFPGLDRVKASNLQMPILLVNGQHTMSIHWIGNAVAATVLSQARRTTIRQTGHAPALENPAEFNALVLEFLMLVAVDRPVGGIGRSCNRPEMSAAMRRGNA